MGSQEQQARNGRINLILADTGQVLGPNNRPAFLLHVTLDCNIASPNSVGEDALLALRLLDLSQLPTGCQIIAIPNMSGAPHISKNAEDWTVGDLIGVSNALCITGARGKEAGRNLATAIVLFGNDTAQMVYPAIDNGHVSDEFSISQLIAQPATSNG